jgi:hypothetical protein
MTTISPTARTEEAQVQTAAQRESLCFPLAVMSLRIRIFSNLVHEQSLVSYPAMSTLDAPHTLSHLNSVLLKAVSGPKT